MPGSRVTSQVRQPAILPLAIGLITYQRMAKELEMDPDLVRSPGVKRGLDEAGTAQLFQQTITCPGLAPHIF